MSYALTHRKWWLILLAAGMAFLFTSGVFAAESEAQLTQKSLSMMVSQEKKIRLQGASGKVTWTSSDETVATVSRGMITAVAEGSCVITAVNKNRRYTCDVTVQEASLSQTDISLLRRRRVRLTVKGYDETPVWTSSRPSVASVDENGWVTGKKRGRCRISAQCGDIILTCAVQVVKRDSKALNTFYTDVSTEKKRIFLCGSSTIDQWQRAYEAFSPFKIANVGVGGTDVQYWTRWRRRLITEMQPQPLAVVIYIGSNDVAHGISGSANAASTIRLLKLIRSELNNVPVFYVSICPCWGRRSNWRAIRVSNRKMKAYCRHAKNIYYLDVESEFLDEDSKPDRTLYKVDQIHPNRNGYRIWEKVVAAKVKEVLQEGSK